jgi:succinate dehydrogenase flavin-adding protein (antitoxin of CptAB toxin-antitoxin module)
MLELSNDEVRIFKNVLNYDDQTLYDFIFKKLPLGNIEDENFVNKKLKKFTKLENF